MTTVTSHVGMIIHTTSLDTMAKVIAIYGGTTWVKIEGRFLLGQSSSYSINATGGEATHTLTVNEMPSHTHTQNAHNHEQNAHNHAVAINAGTIVGSYDNACKTNNYVGSMGAMCGNTTATNKAATATNNNTGGGAAHNNMPPYKVVYIWERTA